MRGKSAGLVAVGLALGAGLWAATVSQGSDGDGRRVAADQGSAASPADEGFVDRTNGEILRAFQDDMDTLDSVRHVSEVTVGAQTTTVDVRIGHGDSCYGTVAVDGAVAEALALGKDSYFRASADYWRNVGLGMAAASIPDVSDWWVRIPTADAPTDVCANLLGASWSDVAPTVSDADERDFVVGEVAGTPAVTLTGSQDGEEVSFSIGSEPGRHYLLRMTNVTDEAQAEFLFSEFNVPFSEREAPDPSEVAQLFTPGFGDQDE